jgi:hypothetical protein
MRTFMPTPRIFLSLLHGQRVLQYLMTLDGNTRLSFNLKYLITVSQLNTPNNHRTHYFTTFPSRTNGALLTSYIRYMDPSSLRVPTSGTFMNSVKTLENLSFFHTCIYLLFSPIKSLIPVWLNWALWSLIFWNSWLIHTFKWASIQLIVPFFLSLYMLSHCWLFVCRYLSMWSIIYLDSKFWIWVWDNAATRCLTCEFYQLWRLSFRHSQSIWVVPRCLLALFCFFQALDMIVEVCVFLMPAH